MGTDPKSSSTEVDRYLIGGVDAWSDDFKLLESTFIAVPQFDRMKERGRCFISGRRGSGKSALAVMSAKSPSWDIKKIIPGERSQYGAYLDIVDDLVARVQLGARIDVRRAIQLLWHYAIPILILKTIAEEAPRFNLDKDTRIKAIIGYLEEAGYWGQELGIILYKLFQGAQKQLNPDGSGVANFYQALQDPYHSSEFQQLMRDIPGLLGEKRLLLVIDTLESYKVYDDSMREGLRGVIAAIIGALSDTNFRGVDIRFFIPTEADLFEDIFADIPGKSLSRTIFLSWRFSDLLKLITIRFLAMLMRERLVADPALLALKKLAEDARLGVIDPRLLRKQFWYSHNFLPEEITNREGFKEDTFAYLLRHTQRRPREIIFIFNEIIREACFSNQLPHIGESSILTGMHGEGTLTLLVSDALSPYEGYITQTLNLARSVLYGRSRFMHGIEFKRMARAIYSLRPIPAIDPEHFAQILLHSGIVGLITEDAGSPRNANYYCKGQFEYLLRGRVPLRDDLKYCVHPMVAELFQMSTHVGEPAVYPIPADDTWLEQAIGIL